MKFEQMGEALADKYKTTAFAQITDLEKAQQVKVSTELLEGVLKVITNLKKMGYEEVFLAVEKDMPLVIGGKTVGIAIAPRIE